MTRVHRIIAGLTLLLAACPGSEDLQTAAEPPEVPTPQPAAEVVQVPAVTYACGKGSPSDYQEIYPTNVLDVGDQYYFRELGGILTRFKTVQFDKYSMTVFREALAAAGGMDAVEHVYDPGTGTGALAFAALSLGAKRAVVTDLDPLALENALFNARALGVEARVEGRLVTWEDQGAWAVAGSTERFDLVVCDPPQGYHAYMERVFPDVDERAANVRESFFISDPDACFLKSLFAGLDAHLSRRGRALIMMKVDIGKHLLIELAKTHGLRADVVWTEREHDRSAFRRIGVDSRHEDLSSNAVVYEITRAR